MTGNQVRRITIPTPYRVGDVHCYTAELAGASVLFDTGPPTGEARSVLERELDLDHLDWVILTHTHIDHFGQTAWLAERTPARILVPELDIVKLTHRQERLAFSRVLLAGYGFSPTQIDNMEQVLGELEAEFRIPKHWEVMEEILPASGLPVRAVSCPGHSQTDMVYLVGDDAVSGDVLLPGIFQTPLLDLDFRNMSDRFQNYRAYCRTVGVLGGMTEYRFRPGHHDDVTNPLKVVGEYVERMLDRAAAVRRIGADGTPARILSRLYPLADEDPFLAYVKVSEIVFFQDFLADPLRLRQALEPTGHLSGLVGRLRRLEEA